MSPDADNAHAPGSVQLVKDGCRNKDFSSIIPHQVECFMPCLYFFVVDVIHISVQLL